MRFIFFILSMAPNTSWSVDEGNEFLSVDTLVEKAPLGTIFKAKEDIAYGNWVFDFIFAKHTKFILDQKNPEDIQLKVFPKGIDISKKWKLKTKYSEVVIPRDIFEELVEKLEMTNFRKKVIEALERK